VNWLGSSGAKADRHGRHLELGADQNLNAAVEGWIGAEGAVLWALAARGQAKDKQSGQKTKA
jgi:ATP/maltotriose-dependent transcriptional regulator MalT